jgi:tetrahydromethanopterin S-methyltransferase subunit C
MNPFGNEPAPVIGLIVRFICGAVVGVLVAIGTGWAIGWSGRGGTIAVMAAFAVLFGVMAAYWGDDFWDSLGEFPWWWI